jgi:hypothetical protein
MIISPVGVGCAVRQLYRSGANGIAGPSTARVLAAQARPTRLADQHLLTDRVAARVIVGAGGRGPDWPGGVPGVRSQLT